MIRLRSTRVVAVGLCLISTSALSSEHTGYWNQLTPQGSAFKCEGVYSKDQLVNVLRQAGWRVDDGIPRINWNLDEAVIVAPSQSYKNGRMVFFTLERRGESIVLDYGWKPLEGSESVGANTASFGSIGEGKPTTIVVSYRRGLDSGLRFTCSNRGFVQ